MTNRQKMTKIKNNNKMKMSPIKRENN